MTEQTHMTNAQGHLVPIETVKPHDRLKDDVVRELVDRAVQMNHALAAFKARAMSEVETFREIVLEKYDVTVGGAKGNIELKSYDGSLIVRVQIGESITFGPELEAAKALIEECVRDWSADSNANVRALIEHAFQVNKAGKIDTARVLGLRSLDIEDEKWKRAMDAITDSIQVSGSKPYLRIYRRDLETNDEVAIPLDLARV